METKTLAKVNNISIMLNCTIAVIFFFLQKITIFAPPKNNKNNPHTSVTLQRQSSGSYPVGALV